MNINKNCICTVLIAILTASMFFSGCGTTADSTKVSAEENLMTSIKKSEAAPTYNFKDVVDTPPQYSAFTDATATFAINLLKQSSKGKPDNVLVSPLSTAMVLGITENGTGSATSAEFKKLLGDGQLSVDELNFCYSYIGNRLVSFNDDNNKLNIANSIWLKQNLDVKRTFLQKNADFFNSSVFNLDFSDGNTVKKMNNWAADNTNNLIKDIVSKIDADTVMYLLNTVALEADWTNPYTVKDVSKGSFAGLNGNIPSEFLNSTERYIKSDKATGFIKNISGIPCKFVAILPNENYTVDSYLENLTGNEYLSLLNSMSATDFAAISMPPFSYSWSSSLKEPLASMGLKTVFTPNADFGNMTKEDVFIDDVYQKTTVQVSPAGIKAGVATSVKIDTTSAQQITNKVILNKPFIFAVVDNESNIPIFLGTVYNPENSN